MKSINAVCRIDWPLFRETHDSSSALNANVAPKGRNSKLRYGICFGWGPSSYNDIQTRIW